MTVLELVQWMGNHADGAPDSALWCREATVLEARLKRVSPQLPELAVLEVMGWAEDHLDVEPVCDLYERLTSEHCIRCGELWSWDGDTESTRVCASCRAPE